MICIFDHFDASTNKQDLHVIIHLGNKIRKEEITGIIIILDIFIAHISSMYGAQASKHSNIIQALLGY